MDLDVVIGVELAVAIRNKQPNSDASVVAMEKDCEVGAHILSGAVVYPVGVDELLPG
jgi:electron-transferring-flavoprotein dehydrogenase